MNHLRDLSCRQQKNVCNSNQDFGDFFGVKYARFFGFTRIEIVPRFYVMCTLPSPPPLQNIGGSIFSGIEMVMFATLTLLLFCWC